MKQAARPDIQSRTRRKETAVLFYRGDFSHGQILEGIDKIKLALHPYLLRFINWKKQIDTKNYVQIGSNKASFCSGCKLYPYLNIHGEFIDPERDIRDCIADAVLLLIQRDVLAIFSEHETAGELKPYITKSFILKNLELFIPYPKELEFSFDFTPEALRIKENTRIIDGTDEDGKAHYLKIPIRQRIPALVKIKNTFYSGDYKKTRKSAVYIYDRARKLIDANNIPRESIERNPYKTRLEFKLVSSNNTRMSLKNIRGTRDEMIRRFTPLLANLYKRWFDDCVEIQCDELHPHFGAILEKAQCAGKYTRCKDLAIRQKDRNGIPLPGDETVRRMLIHEIGIHKRKIKRKEAKNGQRKYGRRLIAELTEKEIYAGAFNLAYLQTIYDRQDKNNIVFEADGFTFTRNMPFWTKNGPCFTFET